MVEAKVDMMVETLTTMVRLEQPKESYCSRKGAWMVFDWVESLVELKGFAMAESLENLIIAD